MLSILKSKWEFFKVSPKWFNELHSAPSTPPDIMDRNDEVIILQNPESFTENVTYCFGNKSRENHEDSRG